VTCLEGGTCTDNPYATKATRSGTIPYYFPAGQTPADLVERLRGARWRGQIIGPHGSGKSTLLARLAAALSRAGTRVMFARVFQGKEGLAEFWPALEAPSPPDGPLVFMIDGFEQLRFGTRWSITRTCQRRDYGLLITGHRPQLGLPVVYRARMSEGIAWEVVSRLTMAPSLMPPRELLARLLAKHEGNLREVLLDLYDWHEIIK
jgi:hypothetical protein